MAWVDTFLSLKGGPGSEGPIGPTGLGGAGIRPSFATVYSDSDPSQASLQSIHSEIMPGYLSTPLPPINFRPDGIAVDSMGTYYMTSAINHCVYKVDKDGNTTTIIGTGTPGRYSGNFVTTRRTHVYQENPRLYDTFLDHPVNPGTFFSLTSPTGIVLDERNNRLYISDTDANYIISYNIVNGAVEILGYSLLFTFSDMLNIQFPAAATPILNRPTRLSLGKAQIHANVLNDVLFIANSEGHSVIQYVFPDNRDEHPHIYQDVYTVRIDPPTGESYSVIAGSGIGGFSGDGGPATSAMLKRPRQACQVFCDLTQSIILIADEGNNRVRKVVIPANPAVPSTITTVIGNGEFGNGYRYDSSSSSGFASEATIDPLNTAVTPFGIIYSLNADTAYITSGKLVNKVTGLLRGTPAFSTIIGNRITPYSTYINVVGLATESSVDGLYGTPQFDYNGNILIPGNSNYPVLCYTTLRVIITLPPPAPILGDIINWVTRYDNGTGFQGLSQWVYNDYLPYFKLGTSFPSTWMQVGSIVPVIPAVGVTGSASTVTGATGPDGPSVRGPVGPTGPNQTQAPDGRAGPTGATGITNYNDSVGPTGFDGPDGDIGSIGADGNSAQGNTGPTGRDGIQGIRHANFYQDLPYPHASTPITDPFPVTSLEGDYYIKSDTTELYYYQETVPPDTYYLNRILNTSTGAFNVPGITGSLYYPLNTPVIAGGVHMNNAFQTQAERDATHQTAINNYNNAEMNTYRYQELGALQAFDTARYELNSDNVLYNVGGNTQLNGSLTPWTTPKSPYIYEFLPVPSSLITTRYYNRNYYANVSIDLTSCPGAFVVAGHVNPLFPLSDTPETSGRPLYIISMTDLSGNLSFVQYQIYWLYDVIPISPSIPPSAVIAAYVGMAANKKISPTNTDIIGYDLSLFFTNANYGSNNYVHFDTPNILPDNCEATMMYGANGRTIFGSDPYQYAWKTRLHFGGLIELRLSLGITEFFSNGYLVPIHYGLYGLLNSSTTATNVPIYPNNYTSSLVTTVKFPDRATTILPDSNITHDDTLYCNVIAVHPTTHDIYFTQEIRDGPDIVGHEVLKLSSSDLTTDGHTYSAITKVFGKIPSSVFCPDGTLLADISCKYISGMTFDNIGNLYYSDLYVNQVRKISFVVNNPALSTVIGNSDASSADSTDGARLGLSGPHGLCCSHGYLYIADTDNFRIIKVDIANRGIPPLTIGKFPGSPSLPNSTLTRARGVDRNTLFRCPSDVKVDSSENIYVCDTGNYCIWRVNIAKDEIILFVGTWDHWGVDIPQNHPPDPDSVEALLPLILAGIQLVFLFAALVFSLGAASVAVPLLAADLGGGAAAIGEATVAVSEGASAVTASGIGEAAVVAQGIAAEASSINIVAAAVVEAEAAAAGASEAAAAAAAAARAAATAVGEIVEATSGLGQAAAEAAAAAESAQGVAAGLAGAARTGLTYLPPQVVTAGFNRAVSTYGSAFRAYAQATARTVQNYNYTALARNVPIPEPPVVPIPEPPPVWTIPGPPPTIPPPALPPLPPVVPPPPIPIPPPNIALPLIAVDIPIIVEQMVQRNGSNLLYPGFASLAVIGLGIFAYLDAYYISNPTAPTGATHIQGGIYPGNSGVNVNGPFATLMRPTQIALHGNSLFIADELDNRIRVVDIVTGKVNNITLPFAGIDTTTEIELVHSFPLKELEEMMRLRYNARHLSNETTDNGWMINWPTEDRYGSNSGGISRRYWAGYGPPVHTYHVYGGYEGTVWNVTDGFFMKVKPYKAERGLENVPAIRTGISNLKGLAVSPNGTVYFSEVNKVFNITGASVPDDNLFITRYNISDTTGILVGTPVTIRGIDSPGYLGFNGNGVILSVNTNSSVTVNIISGGTPGSDWSKAILIPEARLRQIPVTAF